MPEKETGSFRSLVPESECARSVLSPPHGNFMKCERSMIGLTYICGTRRANKRVSPVLPVLWTLNWFLTCIKHLCLAAGWGI
jgi:hypothetical protein